jgi:SAM-dependent methyltransferase
MRCRICGANLEEPFLSLGKSPIANSLLTREDLHKMEPYFPLDLYVCQICWLVQLEEFEAPEKIFSSDYPYFSSYSESWLKHCKNYAEMMVERFGFDKNSFVVEVGSNDGYLLQYFKEHNIPILGVEPAENVARTAIAKGIPTDITFFNTSYAKKLREKVKLADLIIGNNVLAHNPNLHDFVEAMKVALKPNGIITMEFPHLMRLIQENQFDTIYHEHFSYFSFYAVKKLFSLHELEIFDVEEIPTHGGSLRIYAKHKGANGKLLATTKRVEELLEKEKDFGLFDLQTYSNFRKKVEATKRAFLLFLIKAKNEGKKIVGYGAPAKASTLLNYCGVRTDFIDYTVDRNPHKQGKFIPGVHIPIKHPDKIKEDKPDYVIIFPWNIKDEIMEQLKYIREWGGKFVVPIPELKVY